MKWDVEERKTALEESLAELPLNVRVPARMFLRNTIAKLIKKYGLDRLEKMCDGVILSSGWALTGRRTRFVVFQSLRYYFEFRKYAGLYLVTFTKVETVKEKQSEGYDNEKKH